MLYLTIDNNRLETAAPAAGAEDRRRAGSRRSREARDRQRRESQFADRRQAAAALGTRATATTTPEGATPLWRAAKTSDVELTALLLAAGADPGFTSRDGISPLMVAAGQGWVDGKSLGAEEESIAVIRLLLGAGVDVNLKNNRGETALHGAAGKGADKVVRFLADNGATLDAKDRFQPNASGCRAGGPSMVPRAPNDYREPEVKKSTVEVLRELMTAKGVNIEPYVKPEVPKPAQP